MVGRKFLKKISYCIWILTASSDVMAEHHKEYKNILLNSVHYGVPQERKRVIIFGVNKKLKNFKSISKKFYETLRSQEIKKIITVKQAIGDLDKFYPLNKITRINGRKFSHKSNSKKHQFDSVDVFLHRFLVDDLILVILKSSSKSEFVFVHAFMSFFLLDIDFLLQHKSNSRTSISLSICMRS